MRAAGCHETGTPLSVESVNDPSPAESQMEERTARFVVAYDRVDFDMIAGLPRHGQTRRDPYVHGQRGLSGFLRGFAKPQDPQFALQHHVGPRSDIGHGGIPLGDNRKKEHNDNETLYPHIHHRHCVD